MSNEIFSTFLKLKDLRKSILLYLRLSFATTNWIIIAYKYVQLKAAKSSKKAAKSSKKAEKAKFI